MLNFDWVFDSSLAGESWVSQISGNFQNFQKVEKIFLGEGRVEERG